MTRELNSQLDGVSDQAQRTTIINNYKNSLSTLPEELASYAATGIFGTVGITVLTCTYLAKRWYNSAAFPLSVATLSQYITNQALDYYLDHPLEDSLDFWHHDRSLAESS